MPYKKKPARKRDPKLSRDLLIMSLWTNGTGPREIAEMLGFSRPLVQLVISTMKARLKVT